jgi:hypothetical protein
MAALGLLVVGSTARADDDDVPGEPGVDVAPRPLPAPEEAAAAAAVVSSAPISTDDGRTLYALGVRGRLFLAPGWMLAPFLDQYNAVTRGSIGLEFTRRRGTFDVVTSLDFTWMSPADGNFLGAGKDPTLDTHYVEFRGFNFLSLDVSFYYHHEVTRWLEVLVGGGIGLGLVLGDIDDINGSSQVCTAANRGDPSKCYPISSDTYQNAQGQTVTVGAIKPGDPDFERKLDATAQSQARCNAMNTSGQLDCRDTSLHPHFHVVTEKPPVMVVVNFLVGLRFKLHRHANLNLTGGFRNGWVVGMGPEYVF